MSSRCNVLIKYDLSKVSASNIPTICKVKNKHLVLKLSSLKLRKWHLVSNLSSWKNHWTIFWLKHETFSEVRRVCEDPTIADRKPSKDHHCPPNPKARLTIVQIDSNSPWHSCSRSLVNLLSDSNEKRIACLREASSSEPLSWDVTQR